MSVAAWWLRLVEPDLREIGTRMAGGIGDIAQVLGPHAEPAELEQVDERQVALSDLLQLDVQVASFGRIGFRLRRFNHMVHLGARVAGRVEPGCAFGFRFRPVMLLYADLRIQAVRAPGADELEVVVREHVLDPGREVLSPQGDVDTNAAQRLTNGFTGSTIVVAIRNEIVVELETPAVRLLREARFVEQGFG